MSDVVETRENGNGFDISSKHNNNAQAQEQEVNDCSEFLKIEYAKYRQYKIILEGIEDCIEDDNNLDSNLRTKIKKIILGEQVSQVRLSENPIRPAFESVLGVPLGGELTYSESSRLHSCLKSKLENKYARLRNECFSFFDKDEFVTSQARNESPLELAQDDVILLQTRNQLAAEQETYIKNQIELLELLEELKNTRLNVVPGVTDQKYHECDFRTRINYLKSQLAREKYRIDVFMETSFSLKAYTELIKDIKRQQEDLTQEIERLKNLKKKYADVSCKEYDDILKSYLQYKSSLEKKKLMYELYG